MRRQFKSIPLCTLKNDRKMRNIRNRWRRNYNHAARQTSQKIIQENLPDVRQAPGDLLE